MQNICSDKRHEDSGFTKNVRVRSYGAMKQRNEFNKILNISLHTRYTWRTSGARKFCVGYTHYRIDITQKDIWNKVRNRLIHRLQQHGSGSESFRIGSNDVRKDWFTKARTYTKAADVPKRAGAIEYRRKRIFQCWRNSILLFCLWLGHAFASKQAAAAYSDRNLPRRVLFRRTFWAIGVFFVQSDVVADVILLTVAIDAWCQRLGGEKKRRVRLSKPWFYTNGGR